jgi:4-amino-4-deoxy-L-arabinose transferase-like glycosyltransferase
VLEREWREASDMRPSKLGLAVVLLVAAVLRFWALGHGIPFALGVDEPEIMERAVGMMKTGSFNPRFFDYPGFYIHLQAAVASVRFLVGAIGGAWGSLDQAPVEAFYLWARAVTALFGVATVLLVFHVAMRWGARYALLAAGLMAVLPAHVRESHYVLTDVPLTFFVTLTLLLSLRAHERGTAVAFLWAGAAAGLATATKYNGALAALMPLLACWLTTQVRPSRLIATLSVIGAAAAAFLLAAPYTILDLPGFLNGFARLTGEYRAASISADPIWMTYLKHLRGIFGGPGVALTAAGLGLSLVRLIQGPGRARWALVAVFPLVYFVFVSRQTIVFARYLLPILPPLCVLTAIAVVSGVSLLRRFEIPRAPRTALIVGLTVLAILPPAVTAVSFNRMIARQGTVALAYDWIQQNIPPKSVVVVESRGVLLPPHYAASNTPQLTRRDYADYRREGVQYLVASSQSYGPFLGDPQRFPKEYAAYMTIFEQSRELVRFTPSRDRPGPELRIMKVEP